MDRQVDRHTVKTDRRTDHRLGDRADFVKSIGILIKTPPTHTPPPLWFWRVLMRTPVVFFIFKRLYRALFEELTGLHDWWFYQFLCVFNMVLICCIFVFIGVYMCFTYFIYVFYVFFFSICIGFKRGNSEGNVHCFYCFLQVFCPPSTLDRLPFIEHAKMWVKKSVFAPPPDRQIYTHTHVTFCISLYNN